MSLRVQIASANHADASQSNYEPKAWNAPELTFVVREPFPSRSSSVSIVFGSISQQNPMQLTLLMAENGVIFSDGIEADYLEFNAGTLASIEVAERKGVLVS